MENIAHQNRVGSPGLSVPDEKCEVQQPDLHKVHDESFQKWNQPAAWQNDQSSTQRSLPAVMSNLHLSAKYQDVLTNWPIGTPDHVSLYFLTRILLIKLQTL